MSKYYIPVLEEIETVDGCIETVDGWEYGVFFDLDEALEMESEIISDALSKKATDPGKHYSFSVFIYEEIDDRNSRIIDVYEAVEDIQ